MQRRRARFGRRARAAIGWSAAIFVAVQAFTGWVFDYHRPLVRFPTARAVLAVVEQDRRPPTYAFFGSSRTGAAIDFGELNRGLAEPGRPITRSASLAVPAGDAITMRFLLDRLLETGLVPQWVVIEISPETVNVENTWWMPMHVLRQLNWEDMPSHAIAAWKGKAGWLYLEARCVPTYTYRKQIGAEARATVRDWLTPATVKVDGTRVPTNNDPIPKPLNWDEIINAPARPAQNDIMERCRLEARFNIRRAVTPYEIRGPVVAALERMLERCRSSGIQVILLGIPTCSPHRAEYTAEVEAVYSEYIARLVRDYDCRYVDGRDWVPDSLFIDTLHVSPAGGTEYTRRLIREVLRDLPTK